MVNKLDIFTAVGFLALASAVLGAWTWAAGPRLWEHFDVRIVLAALSFVWMGLAWALSQRHRDPAPELD